MKEARRNETMRTKSRGADGEELDKMRNVVIGMVQEKLGGVDNNER